MVRGLDQIRDLDPAVPHRRFFQDRVDPVGRRDERGPARRHPAEFERAPRLHHLRGHHHIHVAWRRVERHRRRPPAEAVVMNGVDLDVIGGGAGPLRHARDRGALARIAERFRRGHDPARQHPAALAAEGADHHGEGALGERVRAVGGAVFLGAHAAAPLPFAAPFAYPPSRPMTLLRHLSRTRSSPLGFWMMSAL